MSQNILIIVAHSDGKELNCDGTIAIHRGHRRVGFYAAEAFTLIRHIK